MTQAKSTGICSTCGVPFDRTRPRQRKCPLCVAENVFTCAICREPYERVDDRRACDPCIATLETPKDYPGWLRHLRILGASVTRGKERTISDLGARIQGGEITPEQHEQLMADQTKILEKYAPSDEKSPDLYEQIGVSYDEFMQWFMSAPATQIGERLGIHPEQVQRLRAECMDIPREEVEVARVALGYTPAAWQAWKITRGVIDARIRCALAPKAA